MDRFTRRKTLLSGVALLAAPFVAGAARAAQSDVVVIGAGAAGISSARELRARGLRVVVVEAGARTGGRVHTDHDTFSVPYDIGAHWLHYRETNPFADYGIENGFDIYKSPEEGMMYVGDRAATDDELKAFGKAEKKALSAIGKAGRRGRDVSPASVVPDLADWAPTVNLLQGAYEIAKDFDHFSCTDWYSGEDGTDYYCREGFGALFAHSAKDVPVTLNTKAKSIRWGGQGVEVETDNGTISARAVVVTVSQGVLASGDLKFEPPLPLKKQEAISALTMGYYNHVALRFDKNFFGVGEDGYYTYKIDKSVDGVPHGFAALVDANGTGITYCDLGGAFALQMSRAGPQQTLDFVLSELQKVFGSAVKDALVAHHIYDWTKNPLVYGAYASAEPGGAWSRRELRRQEADRIWFAGEAMSTDDWATVAGAHKSGIVVAKQVAEVLAG